MLDIINGLGYKCPSLVNRIAAMVGGKGGGRPDMAQAGGTMPGKLNEAIRAVPDIVLDML